MNDDWIQVLIRSRAHQYDTARSYENVLRAHGTPRAR
jgi:hypothetical protein